MFYNYLIFSMVAFIFVHLKKNTLFHYLEQLGISIEYAPTKEILKTVQYCQLYLYQFVSDQDNKQLYEHSHHD